MAFLQIAAASFGDDAFKKSFLKIGVLRQGGDISQP
jgi:hypothetical protein